MRIVAHNQQVVRADRESIAHIDAGVHRVDAALARRARRSLHGVVISDYGKGLIDASAHRRRPRVQHGAVITADPKPQNLAAFVGVDCIAPNASEAESASGIAVRNDADLARAARVLMTRTRASTCSSRAASTA